MLTVNIRKNYEKNIFWFKQGKIHFWEVVCPHGIYKIVEMTKSK